MRRPATLRWTGWRSRRDSCRPPPARRPHLLPSGAVHTACPNNLERNRKLKCLQGPQDTRAVRANDGGAQAGRAQCLSKGPRVPFYHTLRPPSRPRHRGWRVCGTNWPAGFQSATSESDADDRRHERKRKAQPAHAGGLNPAPYGRCGHRLKAPRHLIRFDSGFVPYMSEAVQIGEHGTGSAGSAPASLTRQQPDQSGPGIPTGPERLSHTPGPNRGTSTSWLAAVPTGRAHGFRLILTARRNRRRWERAP